VWLLVGHHFNMPCCHICGRKACCQALEGIFNFLHQVKQPLADTGGGGLDQPDIPSAGQRLACSALLEVLEKWPDEVSIQLSAKTAGGAALALSPGAEYLPVLARMPTPRSVQ
jgi:hypothetical protein